VSRTTIFKAAVLILLPWIFLSNCTEIIEVEVDSTYTRLVVEASISTDTLSHLIRLSTTSDYFNNQPAPAVSGARVEITDGESIFVFTESDIQPGYYYSDPALHGIAGKTYTLDIGDVDIDQDGNSEHYTAVSKLNYTNPLDSIEIEYFSSFFSGYQVKVYAWDSPNEDYYAFKVYKNGVLLTDTLSELIVQDDAFFNGNYTYGIPSQFLSDSKPEERVRLGDTITFELNGITEEYYHYVIEAQSQIFPQTPLFSGPPANIRSNISNGAIGFFTAYSVRRSSVVATIDVMGKD
jgi:hypothetical protein